MEEPLSFPQFFYCCFLSTAVGVLFCVTIYVILYEIVCDYNGKFVENDHV